MPTWLPSKKDTVVWRSMTRSWKCELLLRRQLTSIHLFNINVAFAQHSLKLHPLRVSHKGMLNCCNLYLWCCVHSQSLQRKVHTKYSSVRLSYEAEASDSKHHTLTLTTSNILTFPCPTSFPLYQRRWSGFVRRGCQLRLEDPVHQLWAQHG